MQCISGMDLTIDLSWVCVCKLSTGFVLLFLEESLADLFMKEINCC